MAKNSEKSFDMKSLISLCLSKWKFITIFTICATLLAGVGTAVLITKKYTASAQLYVQNKTVDSEGNTQSNITSSDMSASNQLVTVCQDIFTSDRMLNIVSETLLKEHNWEMTNSQLRSSILISSKNQNSVMTVSVTTKDPNLSKDIASIVSYNADKVYKDIVKIGSVEIVTDAVVPSGASSPNVKKNTLLGFVAGMVLACAAVIIKDLLDTKVKPSDDLNELYGIPVFAEIMDFEADVKGGATYEYAAKSKKA